MEAFQYRLESIHMILVSGNGVAVSGGPSCLGGSASALAVPLL
jgi:hypothetical protein